MFQTFEVEVLGMDLSDNMVDIAMERAITEKLPSVRLNIPCLPPISLTTKGNGLFKENSMCSTSGPV